MKETFTTDCKEIAKDIFSARRIKISGEKTFIDFFQQVYYLFENEKVFLSGELVRELFFANNCKAKRWLLKTQNNYDKMLQLVFCQNDSNHFPEEFNVILKVQENKSKRKQYQLMLFSSNKIHFSHKKGFISKGFYFVREKKLNNVCEKSY